MKDNKKPEFTKLILRTVMIVYILTVGYGYFIVYQEHSSIDALFTFVGAPTGVAMAFYIWKAKAENLHKNPSWKDLQNNKLYSEEVDINGYSNNNSIGDVLPGSFDSDTVPYNEPEEEMHRMAEIRGGGGRETDGWGNGSA